MNGALKFGYGKGVVLVDTFQVCLELLPNFHGENPIAFRLIFVAELWQRFVLNAS